MFLCTFHRVFIKIVNDCFKSGRVTINPIDANDCLYINFVVGPVHQGATITYLDL